MNKSQLISLIDSLKLPKEEYYVVGGGALVIRNIRELTKDLDICVSEKLFEILKEKYYIKEDSKNDCGFYPLTELVEIVPNKKDSFDREFFNSYPVQNLRSIYEYKKGRNSPKDQADIQNIEKFLENTL